MASQHQQYDEYMREMRIQFQQRLKRQNDEGHDFIVNGTARTVLEGSLDRFYAIIILGASDERLSTKEEFVAKMNMNEMKKEPYRFLAILLYGFCRIQAARVFVERLMAPDSWPLREDGGMVLPADLDHLKKLFGDEPHQTDAQDFYNNQARFCVVVLEERKVVIVKSLKLQRLPFIEEVSRGRGSYGEVFEVKAAEQHFWVAPRQEFRDNELRPNSEPLRLARKDYYRPGVEPSKKGQSGHEHEVLQRIFESPSAKSPNIVEPLGGMLVGNRFSLFMALADCDLKEYMETQNHPTSIATKRDIINSAVGLASGLHYLHNELRTPEDDQLVCYHMDLKPANILVFSGNTGRHVWKLSDFGMSRIKCKRINESDRGRIKEQELGPWKWFVKQFGPELNNSTTGPSASATMNQRGDGAFLAPESQTDGATMNTRSDVWSLGAVLSVVFTFIERGKQGVEDYARLRSSVSGSRETFYWKGPGHTRPQEHPKVNEWHNKLVNHIDVPAEAEPLRAMLQYLQQKALSIQSKDRCTAKQVQEQLETTLRKYRAIIAQASASTEPEAEQLQPRRTNTFLSSLRHRMTLRSSSADKTTASDSQPDPIEKSHLMTSFRPSEFLQSCEISSNAKSLVYWSPQTLLFCGGTNVSSQGHITEMQAKPFALPPGSSCSINKVSLTPRFLIASTNRSHFECFIMDIIHRQYYRVALEEPKIYGVGLSEGEEVQAVFLLGPAAGQSCGSLLYTTISDLLELGVTGPGNNPQPADNRMVELDDSGDITSEGKLSQSKNLKLECLGGDDYSKVACLSISALGHVHFVLHPVPTARYPTQIVRVSGDEHKFMVSRLTISTANDNGQNTSQLACAPFANGDPAACVYVTQAHHMRIRAFPLQSGEGLPLKLDRTISNYRILRLMMGWDNDTVLYALGTKPTRTTILLLEIPVFSDTHSKLAVKTLATLEGLSSNDRFEAKIPSYGGRGERFMLVTKLDMRKSGCQVIYRVSLPDAPSSQQ